MNPKIFIIIINYNGWKDTKDCIKSLEKLTYNNFEVIVVDNNSKERIKITSSRFNIVQFFNKENLGFAGGNNIGINYALNNGADYVLLLNNDTKVISGVLRQLIKVGEENPDIGILGPVILKSGSSDVHFSGGKINWLHTKAAHIEETRHNPSNGKAGKQDTNKIVDYVTGACMLVKKEVIDKINLMPEKYFLYFEDVDWCINAQKANYKCAIVPKSRIYHKISQSTKEGSFSYIYYHTRNGLLLAKRNAPWLIKIFAYLNSFLVFIKQIIKLILFPSKRKWAKAIIKGIKDFYRGKFGQL